MSTRIGFGQMQLWFLLLAVFTLLCSSQPSEVCSIRNLLKELVVSNFFHGINLRNISTSHSPPNHNDTPGAILTVWGGDVPDSYKCQIDSHKLYAEKHGYTYYLINNMTELNWEYHVNSGQLIDIYWFKLLALLHVLKQEPKHPWVLYIDTDDIFENNYNQSEKDHNNMSIEDHLKTIQNYENIHMIFPDNHGWSTDFIFAKNTPMGVKFIEHFWSLRHYCPGCVGEQCAGHIAMFETLLFSIQSLIEQGNDIEDSYNINRDKHGRFSCCHPRSHCRWPHGPKGDMNYDHGNQVQGCVWNWEAALNFTGEYKRDYPYIKLSPNFRSNIGVHHPYKDNQECLDALAMSQTDPNFQWKDFRLRV